MRTVVITAFLVLVGVFSTFSQGYKISVSIKNMEDSTIILGYYFGDNQFAKDTTLLNNAGKGVFQGDEDLPGGMYFILVPGNHIFEFVIDKDQKFSISTEYDGTASSLTDNLTSKGSADMDVYLDYQRFMASQNKKAVSLRKRLKSAGDDKAKQMIKDSLEILHNEVKAKWDYIEKQYPESLLASVLLCVKEIEVPEPPRDKDGNITDSSFQYRYYKKHYFDYVNFSDGRLLRTQFYHPKIERYFDRLVIPAPDSVIKECKMVIDKASANPDLYEYTVKMLFNKYNSSNIMGMDKVTVFFAENYYLNGKATWADSAWVEKLRKRVTEMKPNLVGNPAPELRLLSPDDEFISLHNIHAEYTILFFFEPNCGHCKKATPKMKALADEYWERGVEVLGIYTQANKNEWLKFIESQHLENWINAWDPYNQSNFRHLYDVYATPTIYLLDKDKKIIGKRLDVETVGKILEDEFKRKGNK